jgi:alanyl-tRNA synthetase
VALPWQSSEGNAQHEKQSQEDNVNNVSKWAEDMTRLCDEIRNLRAGRQVLKKELSEEKKARQVDVLETCAAYADALSRRAKRAHADRLKSLNNLKQTVLEQRQDTRVNLALVRMAWGGKAATVR